MQSFPDEFGGGLHRTAKKSNWLRSKVLVLSNFDRPESFRHHDGSQGNQLTGGICVNDSGLKLTSGGEVERPIKGMYFTEFININGNFGHWRQIQPLPTLSSVPP
jgi:hypothetical protein